MGYKHLTFIQRCEIHGLWRAGYTQTKIAEEIGVHKSTISRELKRNMTPIRTSHGFWDFKAGYAQTYADEREKNKTKHIKFTQEIEGFVAENVLEN